MRARVEAAAGGWRISTGRSSTLTTWAGASTVSQWHRFSSCRTLPGNGCWLMKRNASSEMRFGSTPSSCALFCRKWRASSGMSSLRSRNAGNLNRMTFRR